MLRNLWRPNLLNTLAANGKSIGRRHTSTSLYEPVYLDALKPKFPVYTCLNFQVRGYDFPVLESYQRFLHNMADRLDLDVEDGWATPAQQLHVTRLKPYSVSIDSEYKLTVYERNVQVSDVPAKFYPIVLRIAQAALPEGVTLSVMEHQPEHAAIRYVPDNELKQMKEQLEELGGPRRLKKKK